MKHLLGMVGGLLAKKTPAFYIDQGEKSLAAGNLAQAEKDFSKALELAEESKAYDAVALSSRQLGSICESLDKLAVAETHFRKAYQTHEDSEQHQASADCLMLLGKLYHKQRRFPDAEQVLQYAMAIHQSHFGQRAPGIAKAASCLAESYLARGNFQEAEKLLSRAVEIEEGLGQDPRQLAIDTFGLASAYAGQSKDKEAIAAFEKAGKYFDQVSAEFDAGLAHKACACWHHFGKFLAQRDKKQQAMAALQKASTFADQFPGYLEEADLAELKAKTGV
jgi:tetratricopeptide (TPR) repeat protein